MKTYGGVEVQLHPLALPLYVGKQALRAGRFILWEVPRYPLNRWLGWTQFWPGRFEEKKSLASPG
jgi:hypothetical protein